MSKYTITIKQLLKNEFDFGLNSYPIFDENYRETLNNKILYHYYESEIGFETPQLFKFYLNNKMNEIMSYYNELYKAQKDLLNKNSLLDNMNYTEEFKRDSVANSDTTSNGNSKNTSLLQNTPQGRISMVDIENQTWATNLSQGKVDSYDISNSTSTGTENYIKRISGNNGSKYGIEVLNEIKNNLLNIDMLIINELEDLFMGIF